MLILDESGWISFWFHVKLTALIQTMTQVILSKHKVGFL